MTHNDTLSSPGSQAALDHKVKSEQRPPYLDGWSQLAVEFPAEKQRYERNQALLDAAHHAINQDALLEATANRRRQVVEDFYMRIPQDSTLEGAEADLERCLSILLIDVDLDNPDGTPSEELVLPISILDDLQGTLEGQDFLNANALGLEFCNSILRRDDIPWDDEIKMNAAMMWENFQFEKLRRAEQAGMDVYEHYESAMSRSVDRYLLASNEIMALPETNQDEMSLKYAKLGTIYEWSMAILWRQQGFERDEYDHIAIRNANVRKDMAHDGLRKHDVGKSGNYDIERIHYDRHGEEFRRDLLQTKMGRTSTREYREPIQKVTLEGMRMTQIIDAVRELGILYRPLKKGVHAELTQFVRKPDMQKVYNAIDAVRITSDR